MEIICLIAAITVAALLCKMNAKIATRINVWSICRRHKIEFACLKNNCGNNYIFMLARSGELEKQLMELHRAYFYA